MTDSLNEPSGGSKLPGVATLEVLRGLGFETDSAGLSDDSDGLALDFGDLKLKATHRLTPRFASVVMLSGVLRTPRTITDVECQMPQVLESRELGVAWVTWCLDNHAGGEFRPAIPTPWLAEGREWRHLLPWERQRAAWEREQAEYAACPRCVAERRWARPAVRALLEQIASESDQSSVQLDFDGEILTIRFGEGLITLPATGKRWPSAFTVPAGSLRRLPRRFKSEQVSVAVFRGEIIVDGSKLPGAHEVESEATR